MNIITKAIWITVALFGIFGAVATAAQDGQDEPEAREAQDEIDLEDEDQRLAYAIGVNIGGGLVRQGMHEDMDSDALIAGLQDALLERSRLTDDEAREALISFQQRAMERASAEADDNLVAAEEFLAGNAAEDGVTVLESGLQYMVLESGSGGASPAADDTVSVHYHGTLADGSVFDSSVDRGEPAQFGVSQVISGWTEALQLMTVGDKWRLFIPPDLAYGERSPSPDIPANAMLIFDVELLGIE